MPPELLLIVGKLKVTIGANLAEAFMIIVSLTNNRFNERNGN